MKITNFWKECRRIVATLIYPELKSLTDKIVYLLNQLRKYQPSEKENYYNNKYPKVDILYYGRHIPTTNSRIAIDVRDFFTSYDSEVRKLVEELNLEGKSDDEKALECLKWVIQHIKYVSDTTKGYREFWQFPYETLYYKTGDCEDGMILLANLMLIAGIPYWKIRPTAGWVKTPEGKGGHAYLTYYCEEKDKWVILDWCYYPNLLPIKDRKDYKDEELYLESWFSWNLKYAFAKDVRDVTKMKHVQIKNKEPL